jgi:hypothetical protein
MTRAATKSSTRLPGRALPPGKHVPPPDKRKEPGADNRTAWIQAPTRRSFVASERLGLEPSALGAILENVGDAD